ncbi:hypothetical protein P872_19060 [Rhodonellum psychrophilum GCM71 = DSM 17998]|uniref:Uncharacterized protein n=2 Tax=Rhodonellum TaxID=336827 RepID=U5BP07_9BACT|nr:MULTISPECIES: hypothetical protein [Rhodonellum]ERM82285.1 hypothetical protein P872_19060 [Rhodonellum psychrophilum GCM71 = DSM 17998]SDZ25275.1 hypothetical protein SAMN05444412_108129 [Rhodonellum ikkaensis]
MNGCLKIKFSLFIVLILMGLSLELSAQSVYTARGFWEESNKPTYKQIKLKQVLGEPISDDEIGYLNDFEVFLASYYEKMSPEERAKYEKMRVEWDREITAPQKTIIQPEEFEWRGIDRAVNIGYGIYYGASLVSAFEIDNAGAIGIPLVTGGLWALGPILNPKKYDNIDRSVVRAANAGKFLGLIYGGSLGLIAVGNSSDEGRAAFIMSSVGSIAFGEVAFQMQKNRKYSDGHIEIMRHHGILGAFGGLSVVAAAQGETGRPFGIGALVGSTVGLALGNMASKKYEYTRGDARYATNMSSVGVGIGFAISSQIAINGDGGEGLILIPAGFGVLGTIIGQRNAQGVNLTGRQGSTINYASGGAALLGLGIAAIVQSDSPAVILGLASGFALVTQEYLFAKYRNENLNLNLSRSSAVKGINYDLTFRPENYIVNQKLQAGATLFSNYSLLSNPIINLNFKF